jgi:hypothetical protein
MEEVGDVVVDREFDPLGIDQQQPDILGAALNRIEAMKALMATDLPAPVAPAMSRWGMRARLATPACR